MQYGVTGTHKIRDSLLAQTQHLVKILFAVTIILMIQSGHNILHVTT